MRRRSSMETWPPSAIQRRASSCCCRFSRYSFGLGATPNSRLGTIANSVRPVRSRSRPWQQDFIGNQPGDGPIEKHSRAICTGPAQCIEPAIKAKSGRAITEVTESVSPPDLTDGLSGSRSGSNCKRSRIRIPSCCPTNAITPFGVSERFSRKVPRNRVVHNCTANPKRL